MATKKNEVVKKADVEEIDLSAEAGAGMETVTQDDLGIPFLVLLQKGSPQVDEDEPEYIEGAKQGDIIMSSSKTILANQDEYVEFIPCVYRKAYVEWQPRESGGGFVKAHESLAVLQHTKRDPVTNRDMLPNGNIIVTTAYVTGLVVSGEDNVPCMIAFASTQLKKARTWLNTMRAVKLQGPNGPYMAPMYAHVWHLSSQDEDNQKGKWKGWKIEIGPRVKSKTLIEVSRQLKDVSSRQQLSAPQNEEAETAY